jgi:hypothetical protein
MSGHLSPLACISVRAPHVSTVKCSPHTTASVSQKLIYRSEITLQVMPTLLDALRGRSQVDCDTMDFECKCITFTGTTAGLTWLGQWRRNWVHSWTAHRTRPLHTLSSRDRQQETVSCTMMFSSKKQLARPGMNYSTYRAPSRLKNSWWKSWSVRLAKNVTCY